MRIPRRIAALFLVVSVAVVGSAAAAESGTRPGLKGGNPAVRRSLAGKFNGLAKYRRLKAAMVKKGCSFYFRAMETSGFSKVIVDAMNTYSFTFLVPYNTALMRPANRRYLRRLTTSQMQQFLAYHILKRRWGFRALKRVAWKTEFLTADYDLTVARYFSSPAKVLFAPPRTRPAQAGVLLPNAYADPTIAAHVIDGILKPPKYL